MSTEPESNSPQPSELGLDLDLHFLPAWAQKPAEVNPYEKYTGTEEVRGRDRRGRPGRDRDRGPRPDRPRGPGGPGGPRPEGRRPGGPPRGEGDRRGPGGNRGPHRGGPRQGAPERREERPLPELEVSFIPEDKGVESLARQIKLTGRAYPLFEIAYLVLKKPERYHIQLTSKKNAEGQPSQLIYMCGLDDTLWLSEQEATAHVLDKHFNTFYSTEKIPTDPPKGTYTFVAQCGISGTILGPPNYHDYQNKLRKLHQERFARMPFEMFKSRIRIVKDEAVVKKWLEEQSFRTEYTALNIPETLKFSSREEVENHFRQTHLANVIKAVDSHTIPAAPVHDFQNRTLHALVRRHYDEQMRFPLKVVNILSQQFARQGLQFFKVNKSITHVSVARPRFLDMEATPVSEGVKRIVDFINTHPRTTRKQLLEALAPGQQTAAPAPAAPEAAPAAESSTTPEGATSPGTAAEAAPAAGSATTSSAAIQNPEISAVVADLHWLIHQGHVIEFANGPLETAKKPTVKPPKPAKAKPEAGAEQQAISPEGEGEAPTQPAQQSESANDQETGQPEEGSATASVEDESGASAGAQILPQSTAAASSPTEAGTTPSGEEPSGSEEKQGA